MIGIPEVLLSDCGTNLLSHSMKVVCEPPGTTELNTTAYHSPVQWNGREVERDSEDNA